MYDDSDGAAAMSKAWHDHRERQREAHVIPCPVSECGGTGAIPAAWMGVPMCLICRAACGTVPGWATNREPERRTG